MKEPNPSSICRPICSTLSLGARWAGPPGGRGRRGGGRGRGRGAGDRQCIPYMFTAEQPEQDIPETVGLGKEAREWRSLGGWGGGGRGGGGGWRNFMQQQATHVDDTCKKTCLLS